MEGTTLPPQAIVMQSRRSHMATYKVALQIMSSQEHLIGNTYTAIAPQSKILEPARQDYLHLVPKLTT